MRFLVVPLSSLSISRRIPRGRRSLLPKLRLLIFRVFFSYFFYWLTSAVRVRPGTPRLGGGEGGMSGHNLVSMRKAVLSTALIGPFYSARDPGESSKLRADTAGRTTSSSRNVTSRTTTRTGRRSSSSFPCDVRTQPEATRTRHYVASKRFRAKNAKIAEKKSLLIDRQRLASDAESEHGRP